MFALYLNGVLDFHESVIPIQFLDLSEELAAG
jgi:hypothetical protein